MIPNNNIISDDESLLLTQFNRKDRDAFDRIYMLFYNELFYFTSRLYKGTEISADDVIHDVFLRLWENKKQQFEKLINIKAYLFICIKNEWKDYFKHQKHVSKHQQILLSDEDYLVSQIVETELFSYIEEAVTLLPEECKRVFNEYMRGLETKEIARKLNKSEFTIYKQRQQAISILKKRLPKDKLLFILLLLR